MLNTTLQNYKDKLKDLYKKIKAVDTKITSEEKLYLESKLALAKNIAQDIKIDRLEVNMLTYTPDISNIKDKDIEQLINQF